MKIRLNRWVWGLASVGAALAITLALWPDGKSAAVSAQDGPTPTPTAVPGATITVNGSGDTDTRDDCLTLREAIKLSEGTLAVGDLTVAEKAQVVGEPGAGKADTILFSVATVNLTAPLPTISDNDTTIRGPVALDGGGSVTEASLVNAARFTEQDVKYQNFTAQGLRIESNAATQRKFELGDLTFEKSPRGILVEAKGTGEIQFDLSDSWFKDLGIEGLLLKGSASGTYNITGNTFEKLEGKIGANLQLGGGLGDIELLYALNTHVNNGTGTDADELQHTGKIRWDFEHNLWSEGDIGLTTNFAVEGLKNFHDNTYRFHQEAGLDLKLDSPAGTRITAQLRKELWLANDIGWRLDWSGSAELSKELLRAEENRMGLDAFLRANAEGTIQDTGSVYRGNADFGIRLINSPGGQVEAGYRHDVFDDNGTGFLTLGWKYSPTIQDSVIVRNDIHGVHLVDSDALLRTNVICFNGVDGVRAQGDSDVTLYPGNVLDQNGEHEVHNESPDDIPAFANDWGPVNTYEMRSQPFPSDITKIFDVFDSAASGFVDYSSWVEPPVGCVPVMNKDVDQSDQDLDTLANLWLCEGDNCVNNGEGKLVIAERVFNVTNPDGLGSYEFQLKFDSDVFDIDIEDSSWLSNGGTREVDCSMSIFTENDIRWGCVSSGAGLGPLGHGVLANIYVTPKADLVNRLTPGQDNGVVRTLLDENCQLADIYGDPLPGTLPGGLTEVCGDATVTVRILEADLNLDCAVDVLDEQAIAFRYGAFFDNLLYDPWYDLEPALKDFDIDIKDLQKVFGRDGSTCQSPIPEQPPLPPQP